eukprot:Filipodium_phascolosomae@DN2030_c0_g1_i1.p1
MLGKRNPSYENLLNRLKDQVADHLKSAKPMNEFELSKKDVLDMGQFQTYAQVEKDLEGWGINVRELYYNASPAVLYEQALAHEKGTVISSTGALIVKSGKKTGRSPADKRIVREASSEKDVWWGKVNIPFEEASFMSNRERAIDFLNQQDRLFIVDAFAGWEVESRIRIRIITTRAYHALFMQNMLVLPTSEELKEFKPDFVIFNAGVFPANQCNPGVSSPASIAFNFGRGEGVVLGSQYAGEMKKGVLTLVMYKMPKMGMLPLHASANIGPKDDVSLFFGLSGTGKTTLSADPNRALIGDDEHVWHDKGVFNVEGGCYAKCIGLTEEKEPEIYRALIFGSVLENVGFNPDTREVDYDDTVITENTRASYPLSFIPNARIPAKVPFHPTNIVLLTCDAFGVLPPVSKLTPDQVQYHFISGYTAKVAGTEEGVTDPEATFSSCFGAPFLVHPPIVYAKMLAEKQEKHKSDAWLINTGWVGGSFGVGKRISLKYTRAMIDSIHDGTLAKAEYETMPVFGLSVPKSCTNVPSDILMPSKGWSDQSKFTEKLKLLGGLFKKNFTEFESMCPESVIKAGPQM